MSDIEQAPEAETTQEWVYIGQRMSKNKIYHVWRDVNGVEEHWFARNIAPAAVGQAYRVTPAPGGSVYTAGPQSPVYVGRPIEEDRVAAWALQHREARNVEAVLKRQRADAKVDLLAGFTLADVRAEYKRRLPTNRAAYLAAVLDYICN